MGPPAQDDPSELDLLRRRIAELEADRARQDRAEEALRGTLAPGVSFFDSLVTEIARATGADYVSVGELLPGGSRVRTLSLSADGKIAPGFEYDLAGTPCENVVGKELCIHPSGVADLFPRDALLAEMGIQGYAGAPLFDSMKRAIGLLFILFKGSVPDAPRVESLLRVAAIRTSAELDRFRAEGRLRSIFDSNLLGVVTWTSDGGITDANDTFLAHVGYDREDLRSGRIRWTELTPPEFAAADERALEELGARGLCTPYEKEYIRKDGSRIPVLIGGSRATRTPLAGVAFVLDLSDRKVAERAARESDDLNRQIIANIREGLIVHDRSLRYVHFNREMESITGKSEREVLGRLPLEVFPALKKMGIYDDLERALRGESRISADLTYKSHASGETRWTSTRTSPLRNPAGEIVGVIAVVRDVTEIKEVEQALRESESRLSEALRRTQDRVVQLEAQIQRKPSLESLVGKSDRMQEVYRRLRLAAESDVTVLLTGDSGTGKELAARAVHDLGGRKGKPFVAVNCSAIPETLLESELFGHVKGAFTGATRDKVGLFQSAEGGTLFLDEVGDMPASLQVKVLRALQEREIRRVGDERAVKVDVRMVAATNRDLKELIAAGKMREDFYYRIRVFEIRLPALRERREDIPLLVAHFIEKLSKKQRRPVKGIAATALALLEEHSWPGNVRELQNALEQAFVTASGDHLRDSDLPSEIQKKPAAARAPGPESDERARILEALRRVGGRKAEAARQLGISRVTLWKRMSKLGIAAADPSPGRTDERRG